MRNYELVLVVRSSLSEAARKKALEGVKALLKEVKIVKEDEWGQKVLSYPIKGETAGYYIIYSLEGTVAHGLDKKLTGNDALLRHLLLRKD